MKTFDTVPVHIPSKNVFNLSHDVKSSYNFDKLYPILCRSIYPGDTFNVRAEVFARTMPLLAPVMHNVDMHLYFFFVPNRLIWNADKKKDWKIFITGGEKGEENGDTCVLPYWTYTQLHNTGNDEIARNGSLLDHMGFPSIGRADTIQGGHVDKISALPFRAYQLVWNEYFRNQNVQNEIEFDYGQGQISDDDVEALFAFRKKCWEKDYFTSCLPFAQRGEAVKLPISGTGTFTGQIPVSVTSARPAGSQLAYGLIGDEGVDVSGNSVAFNGLGSASANKALTLEGTGAVSAGDLSFTGLEIGTINDFRYCLRLQQWLENNARCGSRYIEQLFSHFGVRSSDARLQRPELLGGGKIPLLFTDVEQTSFGEGESDNVLGDLAGKGTLFGKTSGFKKYFEEHGILLGLLTIIPRTSYSQGIPREWTLFDKTDFYFPEFANLGEQAVLNKEIYYNPADPAVLPPVGSGDDLSPDGVFGYQGRFTEMRYYPSSVHGELKDTLKYWHFGRIFPSLPRLNAQFVEAQTSADVWALTDISEQGYDPFICQIHLDIKAVRPMPKYAVPTL